MANVFDQFDEPAAPAAKAGGNVFDQFDEAPSEAPYAKDVAKQIGSGLVTGVEQIAAFPAHVANLAGGLVEKYIPGMAPSPEQAAERAKLQELIKANRGEGIANYLPKPETVPGQFARTAAEFVPGIVASTPARLALPRAAGVGATAGLTSEAAGQATAGTEYEPYARAGGALIGGAGALRQAERAAAQAAVPTAAEIKAAAGRGYQAARESGVEISPKAAEDMATRLKNSLTESGLDENVAPKTWGILGKLEGAPPEAVMTVQNFQSLRKTLGNAAGSADRSERLAAMSAKHDLDDFLANLPEGATLKGDPKQAAALLREANRNYAAAERALEIDRKLMRAELRSASANSGQNTGNTIRARMADVLLSPKLMRGYTAQELAAMEKIVRGTAAENLLRRIGKFGGGGGGLGQLAATSAGGGLAYALDDPRYLALPLAGMGALGAANRMTAAQAARLNAMIRARAPLAQRTAIPEASSASLLGLLSPQGPEEPSPRPFDRPQFAGPQLPFRQGEQMDNLMASINGPQGYPDFHWVNPAGVDAFLASGPMSTNIEDRRDELGGFDAAAARMRRQGRR